MSKAKIQLLFDANPLVNGPMSGVGYYTQGLIKSLAEAFPHELEITGHYFNFLGKKTNLKTLPQASNITYIESRLIPGKVISICRRLGFQPPIELFVREKFDIALYPNFVSLPSLRKLPSAIVIHDLCYHDIPAYVSSQNRRFLERFVPKAIRQSQLIICVSDFTKTRVQKTYNSVGKEFLVTHNPPMPPTPSDKKILKLLNIRKKYLLYVGTLEPRKNIRGLVVAYTKLPQSIRDEYSLVLAGGTGWYMEEDLNYTRGLVSQGYDILLPGYVNNEQRSALYSHASLFVLASFYEGFGMPILEAMTYGLPCALSDIEVFHEVAGDAATYFNHKDPVAIAETLVKTLENKSIRDRLKARSKEQLKLYSWELVAKEVYKSLVAIKHE